MKPEYRNHWDKDDHELTDAFNDVATAWHGEKTTVPLVPARLDREIKRLAHHDAGEALQKNWLLGYGPQVALAASIFFAISLYFIIGLEQNPGFRNPADASHEAVSRRPTVTTTRSDSDLSISQRESMVKQKQQEQLLDFKAIQSARENARQSAPRFPETGHSWVKLTFVVDDQGRAQTVSVVESCVKREAHSNCIDSDINDRYAIGQIRRNRHTQSGVREEVVIIPPAG